MCSVFFFNWHFENTDKTSDKIMIKELGLLDSWKSTLEDNAKSVAKEQFEKFYCTKR